MTNEKKNEMKAIYIDNDNRIFVLFPCLFKVTSHHT